MNFTENARCHLKGNLAVLRLCLCTSGFQETSFPKDRIRYGTIPGDLTHSTPLLASINSLFSLVKLNDLLLTDHLPWILTFFIKMGHLYSLVIKKKDAFI